MADNLLIPQEVEKPITIIVKDNSANLRKLLTELVNRVNQLEKRIKVLENGN